MRLYASLFQIDKTSIILLFENVILCSRFDSAVSNFKSIQELSGTIFYSSSLPSERPSTRRRGIKVGFRRFWHAVLSVLPRPLCERIVCDLQEINSPPHWHSPINTLLLARVEWLWLAQTSSQWQRRYLQDEQCGGFSSRMMKKKYFSPYLKEIRKFSSQALSSWRFACSKSQGVGRWAHAASSFIRPNFPFPTTSVTSGFSHTALVY